MVRAAEPHHNTRCFVVVPTSGDTLTCAVLVHDGPLTGWIDPLPRTARDRFSGVTTERYHGEQPIWEMR